MEITTNIANLDNTLYGLRNSPNMDKAALKKEQDQEKIEKTAEDFEAFFLTKMMETMFEGISTDGMFGGGHAEKIYRSMLLDQYGRTMAQTGGIGVKDMVMRSILEMQEMETNGYIQG